MSAGERTSLVDGADPHVLAGAWSYGIRRRTTSMMTQPRRTASGRPQDSERVKGAKGPSIGGSKNVWPAASEPLQPANITESTESSTLQ